MVAGALMWRSIPVNLSMVDGGAISVSKAVYIDTREPECACAGGYINVPRAFVSLTGSLMMIASALRMPVRHALGVGAGKPASIAFTSRSPMEWSPSRSSLSA